MISIPTQPKHVNRPSRLGQQVWVKTVIRSTGPADVSVRYEVQEHHQAVGYRVVIGESRPASLTAAGDHRFRHWLTLGGNGSLNVVDMRVRVRDTQGVERRRGFSVFLTA